MGKVLGIFDSGLGGLTVLDSLLGYCDYDRIVYFGDTERVPYGAHKKTTILEYAKQDVRFLLSKGVDEIIVACATVTSNAIGELKQAFEVPIIGIIDAAVEKACKSTINGNIGVIATKASISSNVYEKSINKILPSAKVFNKACPLFVPLIEYGFTHEGVEVSYKACEYYLKDLKENNIDTLILGCTHYPLLKPQIVNVLGENVKLIDVGVALQEKKYQTKTTKLPRIDFYVSNEPEKFTIEMSKFISNNLFIKNSTVSLIHIEDY
ncbi:MAG: glutamate racemase [Clostridia bacterium]|nr:glutamate racemase [Clostridia bacterium]